MEIPVIDCSPLFQNDPAAFEELAHQLDRCARDVGFMYLKNHGIAPEVVTGMEATAQRFFSLKPDFKNQFGFQQEINFGYHAVGSESLDPSKPADLKETFTLRNVMQQLDNTELWPDPVFRRIAASFYYDCRRLAESLTRCFAHALDLPEDFFAEKHTGLTQTLRLLHYPPSESAADGQLGAGAHTDYGTTTFVFQDASGGLEVQDAAGNWRPADPIEGTIVVNTGDLLTRWTNDAYRSTPHRVQVRPAAAKNGRLSIAFFNDPDPDVLVETIPSCTSASDPSNYPSITAHEHILERIAATNV